MTKKPAKTLFKNTIKVNRNINNTKEKKLYTMKTLQKLTPWITVHRTATIRTPTNIDSSKATVRKKIRKEAYSNAKKTIKCKDRGKFHQIKLIPMQTTNLPIGYDINE
jgi:hypothetical protein